jgi:hypothetical protein
VRLPGRRPLAGVLFNFSLQQHKKSGTGASAVNQLFIQYHIFPTGRLAESLLLVLILQSAGLCVAGDSTCSPSGRIDFFLNNSNTLS